MARLTGLCTILPKAKLVSRLIKLSGRRKHWLTKCGNGLLSNMKTFLVWSNNDPNDSFTVEVQDTETLQDAILAALNTVGYSISAQPIENEGEE